MARFGFGVSMVMLSRAIAAAGLPIFKTTTVEAFKSARERPVDVVMHGDSLQLFNGYGWDGALAKAFSDIPAYGLWASPLYPQTVIGTQYSLQGIAGGVVSASTGATTGADALFADRKLPDSTYFYLAAGDLGGANGINLPPEAGLDVNARLRYRMYWGSFNTGSGKFRINARRGDPPYTVIGGATLEVNTNTGTVAEQVTTFDLAAAARNYPVHFMPRISGGTVSVGPNLILAHRVENRDKSNGLSFHSFYANGGQSLWDMAKFYQDLTLERRTWALAKLRDTQIERGYEPRIIVRIASGFNDRNESSVPTRGPAAIATANSSRTRAGYADNLRGLVDTYEAAWKARGWSLSELFFEFVTPYPVTSGDTDLTVFRQGADDVAALSPRYFHLNYGLLTTYAEVSTSGWLTDGLHFTEAAANILAAREAAYINGLDEDVTAPVITSLSALNNTENTTLAHQLTANEVVRWSMVGGADQARFEIVNSVLRWLGNGTKDYENPNDADTNNSYVVQVRATDMQGNQSTIQTITVTVTDVDEIAPTITSGTSPSVFEYEKLTHTLTANESVTWSLVGGADQARFELSGNILRWVGDGTKIYTSPNDADTNNTYIVQVRATDLAGNTTNQTITATVKFTPTSLFAGGAAGLWLPTDLQGIFIDSIAATPVTTNDDVIGLILDQSRMGGKRPDAFIAAQTERVTNGDFSAGTTGWTPAHAAALSVVDGRMVITQTADGTARMSQPMATEIGKTYRLSGRFLPGTNTSNRGVAVSNNALLNSSYAVNFQTFTDERTITLHFVATATTTYIGASATAGLNGQTTIIDDISLKEVPGLPASQAGGTLKPRWKSTTNGRKYDGSDDYMLTGALCGAAGNSMSVKVTFPSVVSAAQVVAGTLGQSSPAGRFWLGITTSGFLCGGVGTNSLSVIVGSTDLRGQTGVATLIENGTTVFLYWNSTLVYTGARAGSPDTTTAITEGAQSINSGSPVSFFSGEVHDLVFRQGVFSDAERLNILNYWSN